MAKFREIFNSKGDAQYIETDLKGWQILTSSHLNKGSAFDLDERRKLNLIGKLPAHTESLDSQVSRLYRQYLNIEGDLNRNNFLYGLKQHNEVAFFKIISDHLEEMLPIIYTPTIGDAVKNYSFQFHTPAGLHFSYPQRAHIKNIIESLDDVEIDLIIITDGEGVLGIGDWGVGGIDICIGKLAVYSCCGGMNPKRVLPIQLDVGTNNPTLLDDPMYLGWRHPRVSGEDYDKFVDEVVHAIRQRFPNIYLHWEDFGRDNARRLLDRYRDKMCTFNDDMQGTGATATACVLSGLRAQNLKLKDQRIVFLGAGTAGTGIADQLCHAMAQEGLSESKAAKNIWMVDADGLLCEDHDGVTPFQLPYARSRREVQKWSKKSAPSLAETVDAIQPTILIGCSTATGAFTKKIVQSMHKHCKHPIIFPLSNPTSKAEATAKDLIEWTNGEAIIATGSPFDPVEYKDRTYRISQCNNAFVFPGLGLGVLAAKANRVTDAMIASACYALAECSPRIQDPSAPVLPSFADIHRVSKTIALAVAKQAQKDKVSSLCDSIDLKETIDHLFWEPKYLPILPIEKDQS